jgi:glycosyltransferase involved in cell wall biosynthesis
MRVAIVAGICVVNDAISNAVADQAVMLSELTMVDHVTIFTQYSDRPLLADEVVHVGDAWQLIRHPAFADADMVILHWGIAYELFDALAILAHDPRLVVHFHNVTPVSLAPGDAATLERSLRQAQLIAGGHIRVWAVSEYNAQTLRDWGVDPADIVVLPLCVERPNGSVPTHSGARSTPVRLVAVGRLVRSKGVDVLVEAVRRLESRTPRSVELRLVSNTALSDPAFRQQLEVQIQQTGLTDIVTFADNASEADLWTLYDWADVVVSPSLHEGLCVPIIEGYLAGCRAVGTRAGNLPNVVIAPDPLAEPGDPDSLADALGFIVDEIARGNRTIPDGADALVQRFARSSIEQQLTTELILATDRNRGRPAR